MMRYLSFLALLFPLWGLGQITTVQGKVLNELGEPVRGATITRKGTLRSVVSAADGTFSLTGALLTDTLRVTSIGYEPQEVLPAAGNPVTVILSRSVARLEEVVVSTGYQTLPRERATGSFFQVGGEVLERRVSPDLVSRLESVTSGLVFNATPGGEKELGIRGRSTIHAGSEPLIVVDNFPYEGDISALNPADVASVTVLKDAAAASIWGVRAGNGVIVITTRRGRTTQPLRLNYTTGLTLETKPDLYYDPAYLEAPGFIELEQTLFARGYYAADEASAAKAPLSPVVELLVKKRDGQLSAPEADAQINALKALDVRRDLERYFYRTGVRQQHHLDLSGGSGKASYYLSGGYDYHQRPQKGDSYTRYSAIAQQTFKPTARLELTAGLSLTRTRNENDLLLSLVSTGGSNSKRLYPYAQFGGADGEALPVVKNYRASFVEGIESRGFLPWQFYPLLERGLNRATATQHETRLQAGAAYTLLRGLSLSVNYQYQQGTGAVRRVNQEESFTARNWVNRYSAVGPTGSVTARNIPPGDLLSLTESALSARNLRAQLNYAYARGAHQLTALAGAEQREVSSDGHTQLLYGYSDERATFSDVNHTTAFSLYPSGSGKIPSGAGVSGTLDRFRSLYANASYTYKDRYTGSVSGRVDGSNFFGVAANQRLVPLYSAGVSWRLDREPFYQVSFLPHLRLRATYGVSGNLDKSVTAYTTARYASNESLVGVPSATITNPPNSDLRWERTALLNLAVDFALKGRRVEGSVEYFRKRGRDLMGVAPLPPSSGLMQVKGNFSAMRGQGVDLVLHTQNTRGALQWRTDLLLSFARDRVTRYKAQLTPANFTLADGLIGGVYPVEGYPVYSVFSYRWGGLDGSGGNPRGYLADTLSTNYTQLVRPAQLEDMVYHGAARPVYFGGMTHTLQWKGFSLAATLGFKAGYYYRRPALNYAGLFNSWTGHREYADRWQKPGDEQRTVVPSLPTVLNVNRESFYTYSEVTVERGDHVRLQDASLTYRWPGGHKAFQDLQLSLIAGNVALLYTASRSGLDPDYYRGGLPAPRTLSVRIKVQF